MTGWWNIRLRQGDAVQFFTVRQLGDQRLLQQGRLLAGLAEGAVSQHAGELYKLRDLIEAVEDQHQGDAGAVQVGQQGSQLLAGVDVEAVERFVEDQQLRIGHQGLTQQGLTRFPGRQVLKPAVQQGADAKLFGQARAAGRIFYLILDNLCGGAAGVFFAGAEQVGVIALPLVADQLLQLLEGEAGYAGEVAFVLAAEQGQVAGQGPREGGFAAAVATDKRPALTRSQVQLVYF